MKHFNNQDGAALVLTLLIITLILLVILTQFYQVTNTRKQVVTMEENMDARNIAEMGIKYFRAIMDQYDGRAAEGDIEVYLQEKFPEPIEKCIDSNDRCFELKLKDNENELSSIISTGRAFEREVVMEDVITFESEEPK